MQQKIKELKSKFVRLTDRRTFYFLLLGIIATIFTVFFSSRLWLPATGTITETPVGTTYQSGNIRIHLKGMKINRQENFMLASIGISDMNISSTSMLKAGAYNDSGKLLAMDVVFSGSNFILVKVPKIQNQKIVSLALQIQDYSLDGNALGKAKTFQFSNLVENIEVDNFLPAFPTESESILFDMVLDLELLQLQQEQIQNTITQNLNIIESAKSKIGEKQEQQQFQTPSEIEESKRQIERFTSSILTAEKDTEKANAALFEMEGSIQSKKQKIAEYKKTHGM